MSPVAPFKYDAFISYSSKDRPWAKRLADDLAKRNLTVFFDRTSLEVGERWEEQLDAAIDASQHLIVFWSQNVSDKSEWVDYERTMFHFKAGASKSDPNKPPRQEMIILLDDSPVVVRNTLQMIPELREAGAYAKGLDNLDGNIWNQVVGRIEKTARSNPNALRVLYAVLASNKQSIGELDFDKDYKYIGTLKGMLKELGINPDDLPGFYGNGPGEWCPFGDSVNILTVLDGLKAAVLKATGKKVEIEWEPIGEDFWSNDHDTAQNEAARLVSELSLVIIDPISLVVDDDIAAAFNLIKGSFYNTTSAVMVLTPFKMFEPSASLRKLVETRADTFATLFYQPPVPPKSTFANFGAGVGDMIDMRRLMLLTLGQYFMTQKGVNNWTNMS